MMNAQNKGITLYPRKKTVRLLSIAIILLLALAWSLVIPTTQLFAADSAADSEVEEMSCIASDNTTIQLSDNGEPACEIVQSTNSDTENDTGSDNVIGSPDSPIILDDTHMPRLVMQLYIPLASR